MAAQPAAGLPAPSHRPSRRFALALGTDLAILAIFLVLLGGRGDPYPHRLGGDRGAFGYGGPVVAQPAALDIAPRLPWSPPPEPEPVPTATPIPEPTVAVVVPVHPDPPAPVPIPIPSIDAILTAAAAAWPEQPDKAQRVALCELGGFANPKAFDLSRIYGGPMQIHRATWERFFLANYGWTWEAVALDLATHFAAARVIYDRSGSWQPWPVCGLR